MQVTLVDLVHNQDLVLRQAGLTLDLAQEQPHCQEHDLGGCRPSAFKADLVANLGWEERKQQVGRDHDKAQAPELLPVLHASLRQSHGCWSH